MGKVFSTGKTFDPSPNGGPELKLASLERAQVKLDSVHCRCLNCRALRIRAAAIFSAAERKGNVTTDELQNIEAITEQMKLCRLAIIVKF